MRRKVTLEVARWLMAAGAFLLMGSSGGVDDEALRLGQKYFEERILKYSDSWFAKTQDNRFVQMKGVHFVAGTRSITEAERANGLEWDGNVEMKGTIYRYYDSGSGWQQWKDWYDSRMVIFVPGFERHISMTRKNGRWMMQPRDNTYRLFGKVDYSCSQVPR